MLELSDVTFRRGDVRILDGITVTVRAGQHWAMLGPNGAGKTTVLGFCGAQPHPTSGTVHVLGERLGRVDMQGLRRHIGHIDPGHPLRSALTVTEVVLTGLRGTIEMPFRWAPTPAEYARAAELIDLLGLDHRAEAAWPILSHGERGRTLIARALIAEPQLLLLDEPTTGLDVAARERLLDTLDDLRRRNPALASVLVTHHVEELPASTSHALLLSGGRTVAAGPVDEVLTSEHVSVAFDYPIRVVRSEGRWAARTGRGA